MKKEDLETGNKLQSRIKEIEGNIEKLGGDLYGDIPEEKKGTVSYIDIMTYGNRSVLKIKPNANSVYSDKAKTNLEYLNQLYRDNVLRTLEDCKNELEKEFELLGK